LSFENKALISLVYFNREETNFVDFVDLGNFVFQYSNVAEKFMANGFELTANYKVHPKINLNANATYTKVEEDLNLRIPELKVNAKIDYQLFENTFLSLAYQYNDDRRDVVFNNSTFMNDDILLDSYSILDFYVSHTILKSKMKLFANVTNVLNAEYQEISNFSTRGRNVTIGFNLSL
jgi:vitamin B12 transporter